MNCTLKEMVDLYERTMTKKEIAEEAERMEEPSISEVFKRTASKAR